MLAQDWRDGADLASYLTSHRVEVGSGFFDNPGLAFAGTPGMTRRPHPARKAKLAASRRSSCSTPIESRWPRLRACRTCGRGSRPSMPTPCARRPAGAVRAAFGGRLHRAAPRRLRHEIPLALLLLVLAWSVYSGLQALWLQHGFWRRLAAFLVGAFGGLAIAVVVLVLALGAVYLVFRRGEDRDPLDENAPDRSTNAAMFERENHYAQNHMISVTQRKPGPHPRVHGPARVLGRRRGGDPLLPPGLPQRHRHHPLRALGHAAGQPRPDLPLELRRQLGELSRGLHHPRPCRADRDLVELDRVPAVREPVPEGRDRRRALQALRPPQHGADPLLVQRLSEPHHRQHPHQCRHPPRAVRRDDRGGGRHTGLPCSGRRPGRSRSSSAARSRASSSAAWASCRSAPASSSSCPRRSTAARRWLQFVSEHIAYNDGRRLRRSAVADPGARRARP